MEARDIMWSRTRQGQVAKQPCPMGSIGKLRGGLTTGPVADTFSSVDYATALCQVYTALEKYGRQLAWLKPRCAEHIVQELWHPELWLKERRS